MAELVSIDVLKQNIKNGKDNAKDRSEITFAAAKKLAATYKTLSTANSKRERKDNPGTRRAVSIAQIAYDAAKKEYFNFYFTYDQAYGEVMASYETLASLNPSRENKIRKEAESYETVHFTFKSKLDKVLVELPDLSDELEGYIASMTGEDSTEENGAPEQPYYYAPQQSVEVAPMSIDVSSMVEEALALVMDKFKAQIDARIESAVGNMQFNIPAAQSVSSGDASAEAPEQVYAGELFVSEKLGALMENVKNLANQITELGAACMQIANQQKDAAELQRKINDMQRSVLRDIQGVQANQKVINADQMAISEEQVVILEEQKATLENQRIVAEAQKNMAEIQQTVMDTQAAIDAAMKDVIRTQKDIINSQQTIMNGNAKNIELARELTEKQAELNTKQREALSEHKRIVRTVKPKKAPEEKNDTPGAPAEE